MASCIKLKLPGIGFQDWILILLLLVVLSPFKTIASNINTTTVTTTTTMPKGMKVKFSRNFEGGSLCKFSNGCNSNQSINQSISLLPKNHTRVQYRVDEKTKTKEQNKRKEKTLTKKYMLQRIDSNISTNT